MVDHFPYISGQPGGRMLGTVNFELSISFHDCVIIIFLG